MSETEIDLADSLRRGMAAHNAGHVAASEFWYRQVLTADPGQLDALLLLGVAGMQQGRLAEAERLIGRLIAINSRVALAYSTLGDCLRSLNRPGDALANYDRALSLDPGLVGTWNNRGSLLQTQGRPDEARKSYEVGLAIQPSDATISRNHASALEEAGRLADALAGYGRTLAISPNHVDALAGRGAVLRKLSRTAAALIDLELALSLQPDHFGALSHRGEAMRDLNRIEDALTSLTRALAVKPDHAGAINNRGIALLFLNRPAHALASFDLALVLDPNRPDWLSNRGIALNALRRWPEALASCARALCLEPAHAEALNVRANALRQLGQADRALANYGRALAIRPRFADGLRDRGDLLRSAGRHAEALADFEARLAIDPAAPYVEGYRLHSQMSCCQWLGFDAHVESLLRAVRAKQRASTPFMLFSITDAERDQAVCADVFCRDSYPPPPESVWKGERYRHDRIRVAYLSPDFREHAIAVLLAGLFERHDRARFEIIALSFGPLEASATRARLERAFDRFIDVSGSSDQEIAALMRRLEIDIAVDLMGHTLNSRLNVFAHRPAPVSVNFFCPTGAAFIDYLMADATAIPESDYRFHRERIVSLPDMVLATDCSRPITAPAPTRRDLGLPEKGFVFCSFNNTYKINPTMFGIWMRLLHRVDGSVLWLQHTSDAATGNLRSEAARHGIEPSRLVFAPRIPSMADHLARYRQADLFLDTLPFNAQTTAVDALWAGLPLLTCLGTTFVGRVAASLLNAVGLPELVVDSLREYESRALALALDAPALAAIRAKLARNRDTYPLFDTDRYRRHVEQAFVTMWERSEAGLPPESFKVSPLPQA
jgi:protein O-GlcNAc transferase